MVHFVAAALAPLISFADVTLASGVRLHYAHQGPAFGPALILLHGYSDSHQSFGRVMPLLPPELRVIAPDLRGHGQSDRPASGYRIGELADDVLQLMDALQIDSAVIVGHSMGSFIAQAIADKAPGRVRSMVLMASAPTLDNAVVRELSTVVESLTDPVARAFIREFQYSTVAAPVPAEFMDQAIANSARVPARVWQALMRGFLEYRPAVTRPRVRTLVLGGKKDTVFSAAEQTALARLFPDGRLQLFDHIGHALHWEEPETFVSALLRFLKTK